MNVERLNNTEKYDKTKGVEATDMDGPKGKTVEPVTETKETPPSYHPTKGRLIDQFA
jgi:hypothetical protein